MAIIWSLRKWNTGSSQLATELGSDLTNSCFVAANVFHGSARQVRLCSFSAQVTKF